MTSNTKPQAKKKLTSECLTFRGRLRYQQGMSLEKMKEEDDALRASGDKILYQIFQNGFNTRYT